MELERRYDRYWEQMGIYDGITPAVTQAIYRVIRHMGEAEVDVPDEFLEQVEQRIDMWSRQPRLVEAIARAHEDEYGAGIARIMLEHGMHPGFLYLAIQESSLKVEAIGPDTRFGIAKGMWQLLPGTARQLGLQTGPLVGLREFDAGDERHDFVKSTRAAATYIRDLYTTDAQASGFLVVASYNWGQNNVIELIRSLPENPGERNYWNLLRKHGSRIPRETRNYVLNIISAAVIGQNPELFGYDFEPPLPTETAGIAESTSDSSPPEEAIN
jgi:hypothetical protein